MLWNDSLKDLLPCEETLHMLLKVDNAKSHTPPLCASCDDENDEDDDRSIFLFETNEKLDVDTSQSLQHLGHFSFPITPRQRTLLLNRQPFQTPKNNRHQPPRSKSFDDVLSTSVARQVLRRGRRRPDRASSVDDLGKWTGVTPDSSRTNVAKPARRLSNDFKKGPVASPSNSALTNVTKPKRRLSNGGYA